VNHDEKLHGCTTVPPHLRLIPRYLSILTGLLMLTGCIPVYALFDEPMRWTAYPTTTGLSYDTQEVAVQDFQAKESYYARCTEPMAPQYYSTYVNIPYKEPNVPVEISDWVYRYAEVPGDFSSEEEAFESLRAWYVNGDRVGACGPVIGGIETSEWIDGDTVHGIPISQVKTYTFSLWTGDYYIHWPDNYKACTLDSTDTKYIHRYRTVRCPTGTYNPATQICVGGSYARVTGYTKYYVSPDPTFCPLEGNPCSPASGNKIQTETDYASKKSDLRVVRYYASQTIGDGFSELGPNWRHNYALRVDGYSPPSYLDHVGIKSSVFDTPQLACSSGWKEIREIVYNGILSDKTSTYRDGFCEVREGTQIVARLLMYDTLYRRADTGSNTAVHAITGKKNQVLAFYMKNDEWLSRYPGTTSFTQTANESSISNTDGTVDTFDTTGKLIRSQNQNKNIVFYTYNTDGRLETVTGPFGDTLAYHYQNDRLSGITTPDGAISYQYDAEGRLQSVIRTDGSERRYHYEDTRFPNYLTGITDENQGRFATWAYDNQGRAISSEHANGAERIDFTYNSDGTTTVTDANGALRTYHFIVQQGQMKIDYIEGDRCATCAGGDTQAYTYDSKGFVASKTDWNGNTTTYTRDSQGRELTRTEASGTPQARTITTTWDTTLNKPLTVTEPEQRTVYTYDTEGRLLSRQQSPIQ
jgi:YD repeat-containing protein